MRLVAILLVYVISVPFLSLVVVGDECEDWHSFWFLSDHTIEGKVLRSNQFTPGGAGFYGPSGRIANALIETWKYWRVVIPYTWCENNQKCEAGIPNIEYDQKDKILDIKFP